MPKPSPALSVGIVLVPDFTMLALAAFIDTLRLTCAGGTSVIHLASFLVERHLGRGRSDKGLRIMLEEQHREGDSPQPPPAFAGLEKVNDRRVRRAMLWIERCHGRPFRSSSIAHEVGLTERHLNRLFRKATGTTMQRFAGKLRLQGARELLLGSNAAITLIAFECGFADASHLAREYRRTYGHSPAAERRTTATSC